MSIKLPIPILILLLPAIAGCSTLIQRTEHGRWVEIGPASTLTLHQPVAIPQDRARVFISNGQISRNSANYRTSCALEVRELSRQGPQLVSPDRFQITRAQHYWTEVAANHSRMAGLCTDRRAEQRRRAAIDPNWLSVLA